MDTIMVNLSKDEIQLILHALMSTQFQQDQQDNAYRLFIRLKELAQH
jgi:hypothetical protein